MSVLVMLIEQEIKNPKIRKGDKRETTGTRKQPCHEIPEVTNVLEHKVEVTNDRRFSSIIRPRGAENGNFSKIINEFLEQDIIKRCYANFISNAFLHQKKDKAVL